MENPDISASLRGGRPALTTGRGDARINYEAIGGRSPLTDLTLAQATAAGRLGSDVLLRSA